jgi:NDP-sugar pyrophosphorylase family protein
VVSAALRQAASAGIRRIVVNLWHLSELMAAVLRQIALPEVELHLSPEPELMGTAGGLALARDRGLLGDRGPVLVLNGDSLLRLSLDPLLERFASSRDLVTVALLPNPDPSRWSRVELDRSGIVTSIEPPSRPGDGPTPLLYPGAMLVSREALEELPTAPRSTPEALWNPARAAGRLGGARVTGSWHEVGTPSDYLGAVLRQLAGRTVVDPTASASDRALLSTSYLGLETRVDNGAEITDSVLACGARVGVDAQVRRAVLLGPVKIADRDTVIDQVRVASLRS